MKNLFHYINRCKNNISLKAFSSLSLILFCFSISISAAEIKFVAADNKSETKICMAAVTDNTKVMVRDIKRLSYRGTAIRYRSLINSLQCNDQYIGNFAKKYDAQNTFAYLDQYTNARNKKQQPNITIKDIAYDQRINKHKDIVLIVGGE